MNQSMGLRQQQSLQQTLSPQMIQSLKLLQIPTLQLEQIIRQELEINPVLEELQEEELTEEQKTEEKKEEPAAEAEVNEDAPEEGELKTDQEDIDWDEYLQEGFDMGIRSSADLSTPANDEEDSPSAPAEKTLEDHLLQQLSEKNITEKVSKVVAHLIGSLNPYGYLVYPVNEIANDLKISLFEVEEARNVLQKFDPPGIGATNLQECLQLQLKAKGLSDSLEMEIVTHHFDTLQKLRLPEIAAATGKEIALVQEAVKFIGLLSPRPALSVAGRKSETIIPDLIVDKIGGKFIAYLNDSSTPRLQISKHYASLLRNKKKTPVETRNFIKDKIMAANWLIKAIEQRKNTILRVMNAIIEHQYDFFEKGPAFIRPLVMQTIADTIGMHISTVSRVANGKYAQTSHGIFELKYFFSSSVEQDGGGEISAEKALRAIKELIENEDPKSPISDQRIVALLKEQNIDIARRTVAKYRDREKILPARLRKKF
jgi:RNA polymerase sigma-54 factor